jgi:hypothetical protein
MSPHEKFIYLVHRCQIIRGIAIAIIEQLIVLQKNVVFTKGSNEPNQTITITDLLYCFIVTMMVSLSSVTFVDNLNFI